MPAALVCALALASACASQPAPFPQGRVVVDTDLPIPQLASWLRVDIFDGQGAWRSSREFALRSASDLPASFSVFLPDERATEEVLVRIRLRPDGAERDYRGERYRGPAPPEAAPGSVQPVPPGDEEPRLQLGGEDRTPPSEPLPDVTVDRLVRVPLGPGVASTTSVLLRAECLGHMANLAERASCVDAAHPLEPAGLGDGLAEGSPTVAGSALLGQELEPPPAREGAAPVRGGAFLLGGDDLDVAALTASFVRSFPPRAAIVTGFAIDREEVSVARMRGAIRGGFVAPVALRVNPGSLATSSAQGAAACTYREAPDPADPERERLPLTCVPFATARAFCQHEGGDLPTEAQWEYVASASGRPRKTRYPWGDAPASCPGVVFARFDDVAIGATECHDLGFPFGLRGAAAATLDVSPDGVRGLTGAAAEWVRGAPLPYDSACYQRAGLVDPSCDAPASELSVRGGSFADPETSATSRAHFPQGNTPTIGFRCVYGR